jgi:hypothetical protein
MLWEEVTLRKICTPPFAQTEIPATALVEILVIFTIDFRYFSSTDCMLSHRNQPAVVSRK